MVDLSIVMWQFTRVTRGYVCCLVVLSLYVYNYVYIYISFYHYVTCSIFHENHSISSGAWLLPLASGDISQIRKLLVMGIPGGLRSPNVPCRIFWGVKELPDYAGLCLCHQVWCMFHPCLIRKNAHLWVSLSRILLYCGFMSYILVVKK